MIQLAGLPENFGNESHEDAGVWFPKGYSGPRDFDRFKEMTEKEFIVQALKANHGRINQTVAHANIPKNTLLRKIKKYSINVREFVEE